MEAEEGLAAGASCDRQATANGNELFQSDSSSIKCNGTGTASNHDGAGPSSDCESATNVPPIGPDSHKEVEMSADKSTVKLERSSSVEGEGPKVKFRMRALGKDLPPSIPLIYRSNCEYNVKTNTLALKQGHHNSEVKMQLHSKADRLLKSIKKPVAVVSICGRYRSGKSYFLSRMLGSSNAFKLGHTMHACTFGIWVGTTILECDDYAVLLLDTEGIDAVGTSGASDATILVLSILLSSYMIYNSLQVPTRSDLEKMSCFTELSRSISIRSGEENEDMTDFRDHFPDFLWLLRDVTLETTDKKTGDVLSATEFLKTQVLYRSRKVMPDVADNVVMCIRNYFPSIECRKLPPPTANKEVMNNIAEREEELTPEFLASTATAVDYVLQSAKVKKGFNGSSVVNGSTLMDLARQYLQAVNVPNAVPALDTSWQKVVDTQLMTLRTALLAEYSKDMQAKLKGKLPMEEGRKDDGNLGNLTLIGIHEQVLKLKQARLEKEMSYLLPVNMHERLHVKSFESRKVDFLASFDLQVATYEEVVVDGDVVERVADGLLFKFIQQNYNESVSFCTEAFQELLLPIEESIRASIKSGGQNGYTFESLQNDAEKMRECYYKKARGPAKDFVFQEKKEVILDRQMKLYESMIGFSKDLFEARQEAFEANKQASEAKRRVDQLEKDIRELEQKLTLKQQELDNVRTDTDRVIKELERDLNKQIEDERHRYEELSRAAELQDDISAEASKQKVQELEAQSKQIMEEMKQEQQKRVRELKQEISETKEKLEQLAAKQTKSGSSTAPKDEKQEGTKSGKKGKKKKKIKEVEIEVDGYKCTVEQEVEEELEENSRSICSIL